MANIDDIRIEFDKYVAPIRSVAMRYSLFLNYHKYDPSMECPEGSYVSVNAIDSVIDFAIWYSTNLAKKEDVDALWTSVSTTPPSELEELYDEAQSLEDDLDNELPVMSGIPCRVHNFISTVARYAEQYEDAETEEERDVIYNAALARNESYVNANFDGDVLEARDEYRDIITNNNNDDRYLYYSAALPGYHNGYFYNLLKPLFLPKTPTWGYVREYNTPFRSELEPLDLSGYCIVGTTPAFYNNLFFVETEKRCGANDEEDPTAWGSWETASVSANPVSFNGTFQLYYYNSMVYRNATDKKWKNEVCFTNGTKHFTFTLYFVYFSELEDDNGIKYHPCYGFKKIVIEPGESLTLTPEGDDSPIKTQVNALENSGFNFIYNNSVSSVFSYLTNCAFPVSIYITFKLAYYTIESDEDDAEEEQSE